jgi:hypothetical protein
MVHELRNRRIALILIVMMAALFIPSPSYAKSYGEADTITYTVAQDDELDFVESDFNDVCDDLTGERLNYVKFSLPSSSEGILYYDFDRVSNSEKVSTNQKYYYRSGSQYISKITFIPKSDFDGTVTISYSGWDDDGNTFTGKVKIKVKESGSSSSSDVRDLKYSIKSNDVLQLSEDDFNKACKDANNKDLDYVKFTLPSSSNGTLYNKYKSKDNYYSKVNDSEKYYYDESPSISDITFVPDSSYEGTLIIKYMGYDIKKNSFSGKIKVTVEEGKSSTDVISYSVASNKSVDFDEEDFYKMSKSLNGQKLDHVNFTLPASTKGVLYYNYSSDGDYEYKVGASKDYYYDEKPSISKITFAPNKSYTGVCKIEFTGYDVKGKYFYGTVEVTINNGNQGTAEVICYTAKTGQPVYFKDQDFYDICKKLTKNPLDYVKFKLPSSSNGTLYYGYTSKDNYTSLVSDSIKYGYGSTPYLMGIAYVPSSSFAGTTVLEYTGYDKEGSTYTGKIQITASSGTTTTSTTPATTTSSGATTNLKKSQYFKDVDEAYSWAVDYIDSLYASGVITGSSDSGVMKQFSPASKITRGDFLLFLCSALNLQTNTSSGNFSDVSKGSYYYDAIATAKAMGIAQGSDNKFYPNSSITREDTMVLALRAMNKSGKIVSAADVNLLLSYSDNNVVSDYAKESVAALINSGIITGSDDKKLHPAESITRVQAVAIIYRIKNK